MTDNKICRICWNTHGWRKPSGAQGKTKNKKAYEFRVGYGHEEWFLDITKIIDGWHYAYLQPIGLHREKYIGQTFNISLYSIDDDTKARWWVGSILGIEVISQKESRRVYSIYKRNGWLKEMEQQLMAVGADIKDFRKIPPEAFAVVRYQPDSVQLLDTPLEFSADDPAVKANYYVLLNAKKTPKLLPATSKFTFVPGHNPKKKSAKTHYEKQSSDIDLVHNAIQTSIYRQLAQLHGDQNVGTEQETGNGSKVDVVVRGTDKKFTFYEIKTTYSVRLCIREAVGQLLEYAFFSKNANAKKLVVVSPNKITSTAIAYLNEIRKLFGIPIYYQRYVPEKDALEDTIY